MLKGLFGRTLFATVSAAALAVVVPYHARAQDSGSPSWWASVEGQYTMIDGGAIDLYDGFKLEPDDGWAGRVTLGGKIGSDWFAEGAFRYGQSGKDNFFYSYGDEGGLDFEYDEDHMVLDLSVGRDVGIGGNGQVRAFAGLRFVRFDGDGDFDLNYYGYGNDFASTTHRFTGGGPRVGVDAMIPVANNLRVDVGAAGALLYGKRKLKVDFEYYGYAYSDSEKKFIPNLEANAALTYVFSPSMSLSAGYRVEYFGNIIPELDESVIEGDEFKIGSTADRLIHGPFLRFTLVGN